MKAAAKWRYVYRAVDQLGTETTPCLRLVGAFEELAEVIQETDQRRRTTVRC